MIIYEKNRLGERIWVAILNLHPRMRRDRDGIYYFILRIILLFVVLFFGEAKT